jgi:hypothetical protein
MVLQAAGRMDRQPFLYLAVALDRDNSVVITTGNPSRPAASLALANGGKCFKDGLLDVVRCIVSAVGFVLVLAHRRSRQCSITGKRDPKAAFDLSAGTRLIQVQSVTDPHADRAGAEADDLVGMIALKAVFAQAGKPRRLWHPRDPVLLKR